MSAPTQELPPWLSFSTTTITETNGAVTTSSTLLYLPLTYYGASIPLGSLWTFGGSTSPTATLSSSLTTAQITTTAISLTSISSSATSLSSISSISSSATPTSSITPTSSSAITTSFSSSSSASLSLSSSTSAPSSTATLAASGGLSHMQMLGIILGTICGAIFLFLLVVTFFVCRRPRNNDETRFAMVTPINEDYFMVPEGGISPGEGSPRHSGEEADPFLRRGSAAALDAGVLAEMRQSTASHPSIAAGGSRPADGSLSSSNKSSSAASGYGTLLDRGAAGVSLPPSTDRRGNILSPEQLRRLDEETVLPPTSDVAAAMTPPRLVDTPDAGLSNYSGLPLSRITPPPFQPHELIRGYGLKRPPSDLSLPQSLHDEPVVYTARRVRVDEPLPSGLESPTYGNARPSSWKGLAGGLAGLANLFKDSSSRRNSQTPSFTATKMTDGELEAGRALLSSGDEPSTSQETRSPPATPRRPFVSSMAERPISSVSARSGASGPSIYHDAQSSLPQTPLQPPPRVLAAGSEFGVLRPAPPSYDDSTQQSSIAAIDVLDIPAPIGVSPFTSTHSSRESGTTSSTRSKLPPFPPGLPRIVNTAAIPRPWDDTTSAGTPSFVADSLGNRQSSGITIDVLEEAPPAAGAGWRTLAGDPRRATFGFVNYEQTPDYASEQASVHSRGATHLSPTSSRSGSRQEPSGSSSSHYSGSSGSVGRSVRHSNSMTSDARRHGRGPGPRSPALSAFGDGISSSAAQLVPLSPMIEQMESESSASAVAHSRIASPVHGSSPSRPTSPVSSTAAMP